MGTEHEAICVCKCSQKRNSKGPLNNRMAKISYHVVRWLLSPVILVLARWAYEQSDHSHKDEGPP